MMVDKDEDYIQEGEKKSKTVRIPADVWNPIVKDAKRHRCKTSQVIVSILGAYYDKNQNAPLLPYQCPACLKVNEPFSNFCNDCGFPLNPAAAGDMKDARAFINKAQEDPAVMAEYADWLKTRKPEK
jgi:hypothetical protein